MRRQILAFIFLATIATKALYAQNETNFDHVNPLGSDQGGIRLKSMSAFMTYYSVAPEAYGGGSSGIPLMSDAGVGGSATLVYTRFRERSKLSIVYTPSYVERLRYSTGNTPNHTLSLNWRRNLTARWTYTISASAVDTSLSDALFAPTRFANVVAAPATFEDLASAMVAGKFTNNELAAILTGAPILESPERMLFYGERVLSASIMTGLSYSRSSRLTYYVNGVANRSQNLKDPNTSATIQPTYLASRTTTGSVTLGVGYSLSPRTRVGVDVSSSRTFSNLQDAYTSTSNLSLGRTMGMNWFLQIHGGIGFIDPIRQYSPLPTGPQYQAGGRIGYKTRAHTFIAAVDRSISDSYGLGAGASLTVTGAWNWRRPGSPWSMSSNFGQQRLLGTKFGPIDSWFATAGFARRLGVHTAMFTQYAYLSNTRLVGGPDWQGNLHTVRVSVVWSPNGGTAQ